MLRILKSFALIAAVAAVAGVGTYSYFSDTATIGNNTFSAGTLDLRIDNDPTPGVQNWVNNFNTNMTFDGIAPGETDQYPGAIDVKNVGSIDGKLNIKLNRTSVSNELSNYLKFTIYYTTTEGDTYNAANKKVEGILADYSGTYPLGDLGANSVGYVGVEWTLLPTAGNDVQGDSVTLDGVFGLEQDIN